MKHLLSCALALMMLVPSPPAASAGAERGRSARTSDQLFMPAAQTWSGLSTPEAAAAELFNAYIALDAERFRRACARPFGDQRTRGHYNRFLDAAARELRESRASGGLPPGGAPVELIKVHPATDPPSTYRTPAAYDQMAARDIRLVEVDAYLAGRGVQSSRVIVLRDPAGQWGAAPRPELFGFRLN